MILSLWAWPITMAILILQQTYKLISPNHAVRSLPESKVNNLTARQDQFSNPEGMAYVCK